MLNEITLKLICKRLDHDFSRDGTGIIFRSVIAQDADRGVIVIARCGDSERVVHFGASALADRRASYDGQLMCGMGNSMLV